MTRLNSYKMVYGIERHSPYTDAVNVSFELYQTRAEASEMMDAAIQKEFEDDLRDCPYMHMNESEGRDEYIRLYIQPNYAIGEFMLVDKG